MNSSIYKQLYVSKKEPLVIEYTQGSNLLPIEFEIMDWTIPTSSTAQIYIEKPSGALIFNAATVSGQSIIVQPTTQMTAEIGANKGQIMIVNGNQILQSFVFILKVFESIIDSSAIESQDEFTALEEALSAVSDVVTHSELQSKGAANKGVYFDSDGSAQPMTYELNKTVPSDASFVNVALNQKGYVPAPSSSNTNQVLLTNNSGVPAWRSFIRYITGSWTYEEGQTRFSVFQKAITDGIIPTSGPPFVGYISAGAGYFVTGYLYTTGSSFSGFAIVGTYNGKSFIGVTNGVFNELT